MNDLVTIITPVYNGEAFLQRAINSCLSQDYQNFELIIIDNCSTDKTRIIGEQNAAKDSRIKYIYTDVKGVSNARNIGLDNAKGNYIQFLDADDELVFNKLSHSLSRFKEDSKLSAVCSGIQFLKDGKIIDTKFPVELFPDSLLAVCLFWPCQPLFKAEVSERFSVDQHYIEDWDYWIRTLYGKNMYFEKEYVGCAAYIHGDNVSQNAFKMYEGGLQISLKTKQLFPKRNFRVKVYDFLYVLIYAYNKNKTEKTDELIAKYAKKKYKIACIITKTPLVGNVIYRKLMSRINNSMYH